MKKTPWFIGLFALFCGAGNLATAHQISVAAGTMRPHASVAASASQSDQHTQHHAEMNQRGNHAMGFSQDKTTHHFRLFADGGAIEVVAKEANDSQSTAQIRSHLSHIAKMFTEGNFSIPMLVHEETPPGAEVMKQLKAVITYRYEELKQGGRVRITTGDAQALAAIQEFLRYQIKEHQTGDSLVVGKP
ncbi:MAG: hypothetical protein HY231_02255 [Acidobacteria bacterium]|nr:hypothetical protein [Acidobacteriota bacterium]